MEVNQNKLEEKSKVLGRAIGQTDAAKALARSEKAIMEDEETKELFEKVRQAEQKLMKKVQGGDEISEDEKEELRELSKKLEAKTVFQQFIAAQSNFEKVMREVNQHIQKGISEGQNSKIIQI
ncbi:MAG: YlbF family regulator [bacterium]